MEDFVLNWQILLIIIFLVGVFASFGRGIYGIVKLFYTTAEAFRSSVRDLTATVETFKQSMEWMRCRNDEEHEEFNERLDDHETTLTDHEKRIWELRNRFKD